MKEEHNQPPSNNKPDVELEVRIVALVLGEASASEREELEQLIDQRADLQAFRQEIENIHGVLNDVADGEWGLTNEADADSDQESNSRKINWKLADDKREHVLAAIAEADVDPSKRRLGSLQLVSIQRSDFWRRNFLRNLAKVAAVLCLAAFFGQMPFVAPLQMARESSRLHSWGGTVNQAATDSRVAPSSTSDISSSYFSDLVESRLEGMEKMDFEEVAEFSGASSFDEASSRQSVVVPSSPMESRFDSATAMTMDMGMDGYGGVGGGMGGTDMGMGMGMADGLASSDGGKWEQVIDDFAAESVPQQHMSGSSGIASRNTPSRLPDLSDILESAAAGQSEPSSKTSFGFRELAEQDASTGASHLFYGGAVNTDAGKRIQANLSDEPADSSNSLDGLFAREKDDFALGREALKRERQLERAPSQLLERVSELEAKPKKEVAAVLRAAEPEKLADATANLNKLQSKKKSEFRFYITPRQNLVAGLDEKSAAEENFSTFSLHVGDVSFKLAQSALAGGSWPEPAKVRIEEFVNALDYGDPLPSQAERVACRVEQAIHPYQQQRNLMRVSMRTAATGRASSTPLRLTFLLDNSGSMERIDRQRTVRRAFALLAGQLQAMDQVTLISFARRPRLLADKMSGIKSAELVRMIENLPSEGGTNLEAALSLAFEKALEQQTPAAQNRVILLTDGAVNLGDANPESLSQLIETMRSRGIAFDAAGIGANGLNDEVLEALTRKGDGRYYLLDSAEAADEGFAHQIAGALRPAAMNVKVQVEFNPERVGQYKLLGFEKHRLAKEDFRNDKVDAAEMAAAEAGVAVYQFEAKPNGEGDVGSVSVRFRDVSTGQMVENRWPIPYHTNALRLDEADASMRMAAVAALFAAKLSGDGIGQLVDLKSLGGLLAGLPNEEHRSKRVSQLQQMIQQARQLQGE